MPCYHPIDAWRCAKGVFFKPTPDSSVIQLPCGNCIGCRLERSRQWATRLVHELSFHEKSSFITLTYKDEMLPPGGTLVVKHFQDFMKRFRREVYPRKIRFFHAGEYGEKRGRPHYHAIIFGEDFKCRKCVPVIGSSLLPSISPHLCESYKVETSPRGDTTWSHPLLDNLWTLDGKSLGSSRIGAVTFESCAYVARYVTKKINGKKALEENGPYSLRHYEKLNFETGEIHELKPEYATMSRRPGIGFLHFEKYANNIYSSDSVVSRGVISKPPKFYDRSLEKVNPMLYAHIKEQREFALAFSSKSDKSPDRLAVREAVKLAQIGHLSRSYEIG